MANTTIGNTSGNYNITAGKDSIVTVGNGNDTTDIAGGTNASITIGNGVDTIVATGGTKNTVTVGSGNDNVTLSGGSGNTLTVGNGVDVINTSSETGDKITAGSGNDTITAGATSSVTAGNGVDTITVGSSSVVTVGSGNDTITAGANSTITASGGGGNDTITAGADSTISGGGGNDKITAGSGSTVTDGNGNDTVILTATTGTKVTLGSGNNNVTASGGSGNSITVGNGNNVITATGDNSDKITAGNGNDKITAGAESIIVAGNGSDTINTGAGSTVTASDGTETLSLLGLTLNIATGGSGDIINTGANSTITAGNGNDSITAGADSKIVVGNGNDTIVAAAGSSITAGSATDSLSLLGLTVSFTVANGSDNITAGADSTIIAGDGNDVITAGAGSTVTVGVVSDTLSLFGLTLGVPGTSGSDTVTAGADSVITVGNGNATVNAGGNSTITVGNGNDTISLQTSDTLTLGSGKDTIVVGSSGTPALTAPAQITVGEESSIALPISVGSAAIIFGADTITGFSTATDKIELSTSQFANFAAVQADAKQIGANTVITLDATDSITLKNVTLSSLKASDFVFVSTAAPTYSITISGIPSGVTLKDNGGALTITDGSVTLTQAQLTGLTLTGGNQATAATLTVTATNPATGSAVSENIALTIDGTVPSQILPTSLSGNENRAIGLGAVSVGASPNSGDPLQTVLSVGDGTISILPSSGGGATVTGDGSASVTLAGTAAQIDAALASGGYFGTTNYYGADTLSVTTTDTADGNQVSGSVGITLADTSTPSQILPTSLSVDENEPIGLGAVSVGASPNSGDPLQTVLSVGDGAIYILPTEGGATVTGYGSASVTLAGTAAQIDASLGNGGYFGATNYYGADTLSVTTTDTADGNQVSGSVGITLADTSTPSQILPTSLSVDENEPIGLGAVSVGASPNSGDPLQTVLSVGDGAIYILPTEGGATVTGYGSASVTLAGTAAQIDASLGNGGYFGATNYYGADTLSVTTTDTADGNQASGSVGITVADTSMPSQSLGSGFSGNENEPIGLGAVSVGASPNSGDPLQTVLSVGDGAIYILPTEGGATVAGYGSASVTLAGTAAQIDASLASASYAGTTNYYGADTLSVTTTDTADGNQVSGSVGITVADTSTPSQILPTSLSVDENEPIGLGAVSVGASPNSGDPLQTVLSVGDGAIYILPTEGGATVTGDGSASVTLAGTAAQIDASLASASYAGTANYYGADTLSVTTTDTADGNQASGSVGITVADTSTPSQILPTSLSVDENEPISLGAVSVGASPNSGDPLQTVLSVGDGAIYILPTEGGATVTGYGSASVTLAGTAAQIDASLTNASYAGTTNYYGADTLSVTTTDTADGNQASGSVGITVADTSTPSQILPTSLSVDENEPISLGAVSVGASPNSGDPLQTVLSVGDGAIYILPTEGGATVTGDGSASVTLAGTAAQIDASLTNASYAGTTNYYGADTLSVTTTDTADGNQVSGSVGITLDQAAPVLGGAISDTATEVGLPGTLGAWQTTTSLPTGKYFATSVVANGYVYEIGGNSDTGSGDANRTLVQYAALNADGTLGAWQTATSLPTGTGEDAATSVVANGYVYEIGGFNYGTVVQYAALDADGTLGAWQTTSSLAGGEYAATSVVANGYVYEIGGLGDQTLVQYAALNADGTLGAWQTTTSLPTGEYDATAVVANGYVYEIGGEDNETLVQYAALNADGTLGAWQTTTSLATGEYAATSVVANGYVYEIGGTHNNDTIVQYAALNADGTLGAWQTTTSLPTGEGFATAVVANGYVYEIGGLGDQTLVQYAPINPGAGVTLGATDTAAFSDDTLGNVTITGLPTNLSGFNGGSYTASTGTWTGSAAQFNALAFAAATAGISTLSISATTAGTDTGAPATETYTLTIDQAAPVLGGAISDTATEVGLPGTLGAWQTTTSLPTGKYFATSVVANGYVYEIGGNSDTGSGDANRTLVQYAALNADGTLGAWQTATSLPTGTGEDAATSVVANGYVYEIGGFNYGTVVQYAALDADGTLGAWQTTSSLAGGEYAATSVVANGYVYEIGGLGDQTLVQYAALNADGTLGAWQTTTSLPTGEYDATAVVANGYVYEIGGEDNETLVQYAALNADGTLGAWQTTTSLATGEYAATSVVANGYVYEIGGTHNNDTIVQYAALNADGTLGAWQTTTSLPTGEGFATAVVANGYVYEIGGLGDQTLVQYAPINPGAGVTLGATDTAAFSDDTLGNVTITGLPTNLSGFNGGSYTASTGTWTGSAAQFNALAFAAATAGISTLSISATTAGTDTGAPATETYTLTIDQAAPVLGGAISDTATEVGLPGTLGAWQTTTSLPTGKYFATSVVANGYVYEIGGNSDTGSGDANRTLVQYAALNADGTLGAWQTATSLPTGTGEDAATSVVANGYVYEIGGFNYGTVVQYAALDADGTLGAWQTTSSLAGGEYAATSVVANGYVYEIGGLGDQTLVQYAALNADGTLGAWQTTTSLPTGEYDATAVVANGYVYEIGGEDNETLVQYAALNADGTLGAWQTTTSLATGEYAATSVVANGYVYEIGGTHNNDTIVQYAALNADGTLGAWQTTTSLPTGEGFATAVVANGYVYEIGGLGDQTLVQYAPINPGAGVTLGATDTAAFSDDTLGNVTITGLPTNLSGFNGGSYTASTGTWTGSAAQFNALAFAAATAGISTLSISATTAGTDTGAPATETYTLTIDQAAPVLGGAISDTATEVGLPGTLGAWQTTTSLPTGKYFATSVVANGYVYEIGGNSDTGSGDANRTLVQYAALNADGTLGAWQTATSLPTGTGEDAATSVVANGYVYEIGGFNYGTVVQYAALDADGTLGAWQTTSSLAGGEYAATSVVANGYVYEIGGLGDQTLVQYAALNADGTLGAWQTTTSLPTGEYDATAVVANGYVYEIGGEDNETLVQYAALNADGTLGAWQTTTSLATGEYAATSVVANGYVYEIGGTHNNDTIVQYAALNADGTLGAWQTTTSLPTGEGFATAVVANGYVYEIGGLGDQTLVQYAPINPGAGVTLGATDTAAFSDDTLGNVTITGLPTNLSGFNGGSYTASTGTWTGSAAQFNALAFAAATAGISTLSISATTAGTDTGAPATETYTLTIDQAAPVLGGASSDTASEGSIVTLGATDTAAFSDDTLGDVTITGLPTDLSGFNGGSYTAATGTWTGSAAQFDGLAFTAGNAGSYTLAISATTAGTDAGAAATENYTLTIDQAPPVLGGAMSDTASEGSIVTLGATDTAAFSDDTLGDVTITGLPTDLSGFNGGSYTAATGTWTGSAAQLDALAFTAAPLGTSTLSISATTAGANAGAPATENYTLTVDQAAPVLGGATWGDTAVEGGPITLGATDTAAYSDDTLGDVTITGLPANSSNFNSGTYTAATGTWTGTAVRFDALSFDAGAAGTSMLSITATTTGADPGAPAMETYGLTVGPPVLTTLFSFNGSDGENPYGRLIADANGDLFGETNEGGTSGDGTVFEIKNNGTVAAPSYASSPTTLVSFTGIGSNGDEPHGGLIVDADGDLFGVTAEGGTSFDGTLFEVKNNGTVSAPSYASSPVTLVTFTGSNGDEPQGGLVMDANGDLFGPTSNGGPAGLGNVFELENNGTVSAPNYASSPVTLVNFTEPTGEIPHGVLIADANGDLFGTAEGGGTNGFGTVFEIKNNGTVTAPSYASSPTTLVSFNGSAGVQQPVGGLIADAHGDLFGAASLGGTDDDGTVFEIENNGTVAAPSYASSPTTLANFNLSDGAQALGSLIIDGNGDLFGTASQGGTDDDGTVFEIKNNGTVAAPNYASSPTTLANLTFGMTPTVGLFADANGNLLGETLSGGANLDGTVFEITNSGYVVPDPYTIANGGSFEIASASEDAVTFAGNTGSLLLDQSQSFVGTVAGLTGQDQIDLKDISFGANTTLGYAANNGNTLGVLTVSDGTHTANIALLGQYSAASFATASDGHGGTMITDPVTVAQTQLTQPHG